MTNDLRELLYQLLQLLGRMEVENGVGLKKVWEWDFEAKKPKLVK